MQRPYIELQLTGPDEGFPFAALRRAADDLSTMLHGVDESMTGKDADEVTWVVEAISMASPMRLQIGCGTAALDPRADAVFAACTEGLATLERCAERPRWFTARALEAAKDLASLVDAGLRRITVAHGERTAEPTHRVSLHVTELLRPRQETGTVEGRLEYVNAHNELRFYVYDTVTNHRIPCVFASRLLEDVRANFCERVEVQGLVSYDMDGQVLSVKTEALRRLPRADELPQFFKVAPLNITGGKDPADYIEELYEDAY